ncbi:MAG: M18 family aminopeptidase [Deltaproteobacteria bacterium]|nr:MAG: M18 family aminopeptidase [Deltaproteobacteria bacterium]
MTTTSYNRDLFQLLDNSPTPFHAVDYMSRVFLEHGFLRLREEEKWKLEKGQSYFVVRNGSALIAFTLGEQQEISDGFCIITAHSDSPSLQIKPRPDMNSQGFHQLGVEVYGGCLLGPWFDRDLSIAGRVCCRQANGSLRVFLLDFKRPVLTIPSVAIHLKREANTTNTINRQKDLPPVSGVFLDGKQPGFAERLREQLHRQYSAQDIAQILSFDMFCYDVQKAAILGFDNDLIASSRLDNLLSAHACMQAMLTAAKQKNGLLYLANHEENGSMSSTGAQGSFLNDIISRISTDNEQKYIALRKSFLISVDNAHASHPNSPELMDGEHPILLNKGVVIKTNANQRYTTDGISSSIFQEICAEAGVTTQKFVMRSDMQCGSTIGPLTAANLGVRALDIGAASLGMHSIRELTGVLDPEFLYKTLYQSLQSEIQLV